MGFMYRRRGSIRHSVLGLQTFSNIVFALALITGLLSWATTTSAVTIGGPFALIAPDGTDRADISRQMALVYFGYTSAPIPAR